MKPEGAAAISRAIREEEIRLRSRFPWLEHQDALALIFFFGALFATALFAVAYARGYLPWWLATGAIAVAVSVLHELEHDLIHGLYFRTRTWLQNTCMFVIWWAKLHVSPWWRTPQHLHHHRRSGQEDDLEERLLGIGLSFGVLRLLVSLHPGVAFIQLLALRRHIRGYSTMRTVAESAPTFLTMLVIWETFFGYLRVHYGFAPAWDPAHALPLNGWPVARNLAVLWLFPNILRHTCLAFASSYCHYFGDVDPENIIEETQILCPWFLWPVQLFCCNFAASHWVHHFVVNQPFYLRLAIAGRVHAAAGKGGVRKNDFSVVTRNNRWAA